MITSGRLSASDVYREHVANSTLCHDRDIGTVPEVMLAVMDPMPSLTQFCKSDSICESCHLKVPSPGMLAKIVLSVLTLLGKDCGMVMCKYSKTSL